MCHILSTTEYDNSNSVSSTDYFREPTKVAFVRPDLTSKRASLNAVSCSLTYFNLRV